MPFIVLFVFPQIVENPIQLIQPGDISGTASQRQYSY